MTMEEEGDTENRGNQGLGPGLPRVQRGLGQVTAPFCASVSSSPGAEATEDCFEGLAQPESQEVPLPPSLPALRTLTEQR